MPDLVPAPTPGADIAPAVPLDRLRAMADDFFGALTPNTRRTYRSHLGAFAAHTGYPSIGEAVGSLIRGGPGDAFTMLSRWKVDLLAAGKAPATVNNCLLAVRSLLHFANDCGVIAWRVKVRQVKGESKDMRGPTREELARLFAACAGPTPMEVRNRVLLRLLYSAALRRAEACSLDVEHVDFERRVLSVLRKGRTVRVDVAMPAALEAALRAWLAIRPDVPGALLLNFDPTGKAPRRLTGDGVAKVLHALAPKAGMDPKKLRPHGVRRRAVTDALSATHGDIRRVMSFSGHRTPAMVMRYDDDRRRVAHDVAAAVEALDDPPAGTPPAPR